ncbi:MAG: ribonuclease R [Leptothrix ochracea]|uniref:ribonuclease R n=2 Tax=Leptothrix ochracea TaxID=735331 RepID=UPI0034E2A392
MQYPSQKFSLMSEIEGTVQGHRDGHGFLITGTDEPDIYLSPQEMRAVLHRDRVRVRVIRQDRKGRPEGRILEIIERRKTPIMGRLLHEGGQWIVAPEDRRFGQDILIPRHNVAEAQVGQVVAVELTEVASLHTQPVGRIAEVLGDIDDPGMEIEIAVRKFEVPHRFSPETLAQAGKLPSRLRAVDRQQRIDLTDVPLVTIDGEDARDFDDAVYCEPCRVDRGKGWRLLVAIADVSHYVKPGQPLDDDAFERSTSVYFPRRVIPMLPEKLSNGLCSLNPDEDRLSMVCDMLVTAQGDVQAYQFYPAVICSHARLTYTTVAALLANTRGPEAQMHADLVPQLIHLHEVYRALLKARGVRGAVDFETTETQIVCDDNGRIEKIVPRVRTEAHRLIEEAMLAANVCAADFIERAKHPALFRVHEGPTPEKRQTLINYLRSMGVTAELSEDPKPAELQAIALQTRDRPDAVQIHTMLLRSMQQAIYTPHNSGHFGLAYTAYTHFTSPIRRYPDLLVHRVIKALLQAKRYKLEIPLPQLGDTAMATAADAWDVAGAHCSANERRADEASRDVEAWLKCKFMRDRLGEVYAGTVSAVTSFGLFVQLDALFVEGLIHITELGGEYFRLDDARQELRGERTGVRYGIGARVRVQVSRVDLDGRRIDFRLMTDSPSAGSNPASGAGLGRERLTASEATLAAVKDADRVLRQAARDKKKPTARHARTDGAGREKARPGRKGAR